MTTSATVKCQGLVYHRGKLGACGQIYTTSVNSYRDRTNKCPVCGSSKAQWSYEKEDNDGE